MNSIKAGLLGFGTIGSGVVKVFQKNGALMQERLGVPVELVKIADLDITSDRGVAVDAAILTTDANAVLEDPEIQVVIELIGGYEPARTFVLQAIGQGKHVVTANKALLAKHGSEIFAAAEAAGVNVLFEAAVGGGIPVISAIRENLGANQIKSLFGILNGTCNYILTRMNEDSADFENVLQDAQSKGYAEADPTFDIEGVDTAHKLALLCSLCFGTRVDFDSIYTEGISRVTALDIQFAGAFGYTLKLLAIGKRSGDQIEARVHPTMIPLNYPLADINGVFNAVRLVGDFVGPVLLSGLGAGSEATASAVMGDVAAIARDLAGGGSLRNPPLAYPQATMRDLGIKPMTEISSCYYLRFFAKDQPGVLGTIAGILGKHQISIESMLQPHRHEAEAVPIVLMTHKAIESNVQAALAEIDRQDVIQDESLFIRIENTLE